MQQAKHAGGAFLSMRLFGIHLAFTQANTLY